MKISTGEYKVCSTIEAKTLAHKIASQVKLGDIIIFKGDLGSGKTFFCREIIQFICGDQTKVASPTFNLLQTYQTKTCEIYHYDLYRLKNATEVYELDIEEAFANHICLIEWPEIIEHLLPLRTMVIDINIIEEESRKILISYL